MLFPYLTFAQSEVGKCKIFAVARYKDANVEIRWIPDNKTILRLGFDNSYTIERSDSGANKFQQIITLMPYTKAQWDTLINNEKNSDTKSGIEMAMNILYTDSAVDKNLNSNGSIAEINEQKSKEDMMYTMVVMSVINERKVAMALGLGYIDNTAIAGKTYTYRIKLNGKSNIYTIEDGIVNIKTITSTILYKNEVFVYPGDKRLSFAWEQKTDLSGYFVERKAEGEAVYKPLNTVPFYPATDQGYEGPVNGAFKDDSLENYKTYQYRFYGNNAFGEKELFAEVKGMPVDLTPPDKPIVKQPKHVKPKEVLLSWEQYGDISDLNGYIIARSNKDSGDYHILNKILLPASTRSYGDTTFNKEGLNFYIVYALDTAGNISSSFPAYVALIDTTPPAKPQIVSAIIDSTGLVTLTIKLGKERDLKGYRLYKSNSTEHEFSVIQEDFKKDYDDTNKIKVVLKDTITLQSLTPKIYYRIKALDFNYNQSVFSDIVAVKRPDIIPPVSPVITKVIVGEKQIEIHFVPSSSEDVKEHTIYRKTKINANWEIVLKFDSKIKMFIDTNVSTGVTYFYTMRAMDSSKLYSKYAHEVNGKPYDSGIRPSVKNFTGSIVDKNIVLKWDYTALKNKKVYFIIYKKDKQGHLVQYDITYDKTFTDKHVDPENSYSVKAMTTDGGKSKMSEIISIKKSQE